MARKKFKIIPETVVENLIAFLDEIQFDAAKDKDSESINKINFCSWAIEQLINSYDGTLSNEDKKEDKSRDDIVDQQFMDWKMPEMTDDDFKKLVENFDSFIKGWEKEYYNDNPKKKPKKTTKEETFEPYIDEGMAAWMSLDEIKEYLLDDPDLSTEEAFELYYDEYKRVQREKEIKNAKSLDDLLKDLGFNTDDDR